MRQINATAIEVSTPEFIEAHACDKAEVNIQLADGVITLPCSMTIFNGLLWRIYHHFNIPITKQRVFFLDRNVDSDTGKVSYSFTSETVTRCTNQIYNELILFHKVPDHMEAVAQVWLCINAFSSFADRYTREYQVSLDILSVAGLCAQEPLKSVLARKIDTSHGPKTAEKQFARDLFTVVTRYLQSQYQKVYVMSLKTTISKSSCEQSCSTAIRFPRCSMHMEPDLTLMTE